MKSPMKFPLASSQLCKRVVAFMPLLSLALGSTLAHAQKVTKVMHMETMNYAVDFGSLMYFPRMKHGNSDDKVSIVHFVHGDVKKVGAQVCRNLGFDRVLDATTQDVVL